MDNMSGDVSRGRELPSARVERELRARIDSGEWQSGQALPAVAQLAADYGVSRTSVSRALKVLADENLIEIVPRWGTFKA